MSEGEIEKRADAGRCKIVDEEEEEFLEDHAYPLLCRFKRGQTTRI